MANTVQCFDDFIRLLRNGCEPFVYHVRELEELYQDKYRRDATFIMQRLEDFASSQNDALPKILSLYEGHTQELLEEYRRYRNTGRYPRSPEGEIERLIEAEQFKREYLYILTLSTVLNRSRYEVRLHFSDMVGRYLPRGSLILEIGAGNCLDALLASQYGKVCVYEKNELSLLWLQILGLKGTVELKTQTYSFDDLDHYDFVVMVELLEHVANPSEYLDGVYAVLKGKGHAYLTFALRMPQVDHLYEFKSVEECQELIDAAGFRLVEEYCTIATHRPFDEKRRWEFARDAKFPVTYCCLVTKQKPAEAEPQIGSFNEELDQVGSFNLEFDPSRADTRCAEEKVSLGAGPWQLAELPRQLQVL